jgi:leader peptidase (prepilin peptidase)/N-methyltransferase
MAALIIFFNTIYSVGGFLHRLNLLILVACLLPMAAVDQKVQKIPNQFLLAALIFRVGLLIAEFIKSKSLAFSMLKDSILGAVIIGAFFLLVFFIFKNSIGMGDIKLFVLLGFYQGLSGVINSVFFSLIVSFFLSVGLLISGKKKRKDAISFGPSILIGTIIAIVLMGF